MILLPQANLFALRAARLRQLAAGHSFAAWLTWLADLCDAQQAVLDSWHPVKPNNSAAWASLSIKAGEQLCAHLPAAHSAKKQVLSAEQWQHRAETVLRFARGEIDGAARDLTDILAGAALQVVASQKAQITPTPDTPSVQQECPCCGAMAVGSIIYAGEQKSGLRYQECCLCGTRWNAVRANCTLCSKGSEVEYASLHQHAAVVAETCTCCLGYSKTMLQTRDISVDPYADDLASLALDVLVGEEGYSRATPNLLLCEGEWG